MTAHVPPPCSCFDCPTHGEALREAYQTAVRELREYREQQSDWEMADD
jgi:hypothetical protein